MSIAPMIDDQLRTAAREAIAAGTSQRELAERSGVPQPRISEFLRGTNIQIHYAAAIAEALGLELRRKRGEEMSYGFRVYTLDELAKEEDDRMGELNRNPVWGNWKYRSDNMTLEHANSYYVNLEECHTSAGLLDWIFQVFCKTWCSVEDGHNLLRAFQDLLRPQGSIVHASEPISVEEVLKSRGFSVPVVPPCNE